jgi:DNA-binding response OmpR family regulator
MKILLIDDDVQILDALAVGLGLQWPESVVLAVRSGEEGLDAFFAHEPDLVVLDVAMPDRNGFDVLREIRRVSDVPVLMLTGRDEDTDQVQALELGADDYLVKPSHHLVLVARIKAALRRAGLPAPMETIPDFAAGDLAINFARHRVTLRGEPVKLTPVEYRLLYHMVRNAGWLLPHEALLQRVWGEDDAASTDHLKVFISRLRAKIEPRGGPHLIETEHGLGYRFVRSAALAQSAG